MLALMDGPDFTDVSGKTVFAYAHPMFWAPYTSTQRAGLKCSLQKNCRTATYCRA